MASGDTLAVFDALASRPPTSNYATIDLRGEHPVLGFGASADEAVDFGGVLPSVYGGGDLSVRITWLATNAAPGEVLWEASFERHEVGVSDLDVEFFGPVSSSSSSANSTGGLTTLAEVLLPAASLAGAAAGEPFRVRIARLASNAVDTLAGGAELFLVELREA